MRQLLICAFALVACGGNDTQHHTPTGPRAPIADAAGSGSAAPEPPPQPAPLVESMATPYFQTGDAADGARAFALEKWADARAAFVKARAATGPGEDAARLDLMLGLIAQETGDHTKAHQYLLAAKAGLPLLQDFVNYHAARSLYFAHDMKRAMELASAVPRDAIHGADAELLVGDLLRASGDHAKVIAHYKDYLARHEIGPRKSETRYRIAEALEQQQAGATQGDWKEIVTLYRAIMVEDPLSAWAKRAKERLVAAKPKLPADLQAFETLTAAEHITRGKELFDAMRNPESEAAYEAALNAKPSAAEKCEASYYKAQSRFKARDRKGSAPMFDDAAVACKAATNKDLWLKSVYQAGRSYSYFNHELATARYQDAQTIDPTHSYSDDAMLREAEEWTARKKPEQVEAVLSQIAVKYPKGDQLAESSWRLGWQAWKQQDYDAAIKWWKKQIELVPHDDNYFGEGQAQYWLGRAYAAKNKPADAIASWKQTIKQYPAAYYALLALNRIREADAKQYEAVVAEISTDPAGFDPKAPAFTFKPRVEWGTKGFARAMEFLRLGLGDSAEAELRKLGLTAPKDKKRVDDADQIEKLWAMAFLFDKAGRHGPAHWPTRWHILEYRKQWPIGANRARWLIAYPKAYEELLSRHATANNVPFAMQIGIVREESAFDPLLESYANAIGLTQMIPVTAQDFSKGTGIDPTRENLRDPEKNVTIGSKFLGYLYKTFDRFTLLVPPGYNCGPACTKRMLKLRGKLASDEFVEAIIDDQARNYTKRVLGTYFTYSWLYEKSIPVIPNVIPASVIPK